MGCERAGNSTDCNARWSFVGAIPGEPGDSLADEILRGVCAVPIAVAGSNVSLCLGLCSHHVLALKLGVQLEVACPPVVERKEDVVVEGAGAVVRVRGAGAVVMVVAVRVGL